MTERQMWRRGFTLIELLVVIAIIALLVSILMPSLSRAKDHAKAVKCAASMHAVGVQLAVYTSECGKYPASYVYADGNGRWDPLNQNANHPDGYLHWSYMLLGGLDSRVADAMFSCPSMTNGGAPRTNPGKESNAWESGQVNQNGSSGGGLADYQAERMSFTANAALMPRNKFTTALSGGQRVNRLVMAEEVDNPASTVAVTEFQNDWKTVSVSDGSGLLSKSHRPICAFWSVGSGANEYKMPLQTPGLIYGTPSDRKTFGIKPYKQVKGTVGLLEGAAGPETNAVGRHHPGGDAEYGGTANFLYADGHVSQKNVMETMEKREWGSRYYSLTGENTILP